MILLIRTNEYYNFNQECFSLYKKRNLIEKNIPSEYAVERLVELIKINGDWKEPEI